MKQIHRLLRLCAVVLLLVLGLASAAHADSPDVEKLLPQATDIGKGFMLKQSGSISAEETFPGSGDAADYLRSFFVAGAWRVFEQGDRRVGVQIIEFRTHDFAVDQTEKDKPEQRTVAATVASTRKTTEGGRTGLELGVAKGRISVEVLVSNAESAFGARDDQLADQVLLAQLARVPSLTDLSKDPGKKVGQTMAWHMGFGTAAAIIAFAVLGDLAGIWRSRGEREWALLHLFAQRWTPVPAEVHDVTDEVRKTLRRRLVIKSVLVIGFATLMGGLIAWPELSLNVGLVITAAVVIVLGIGGALISQARMGSRSAHGRAASVLVGLGVAAAGLMIGAGATIISSGIGGLTLVRNPTVVVISLALLMMGAMVMTKSRVPIRFVQRLLQPVVRARLQQDERRPVVLLRSFQDDALEVRTPNTQLDGLEALAGESYSRFEEIIAWRAWQTGPVLAIGQPGTVLQPLGAARDYFSDDEWQEAVDERAADARAIVMVVGRSPGLVWEIRKILSKGYLAKTVFVLPPVSREESQLRIEVLCMALGLDVDALDPGPNTFVVAFFFRPDGALVLETCPGRPGQAYAAALDHALASIPEQPAELHEPGMLVRRTYQESLEPRLVSFSTFRTQAPRTSLASKLYDLVQMLGPVLVAILASLMG